MMTGEINFDDAFYEDDATQLPFYESARVAYLLFVVMVTIILLNLLIAMTVSDTQVNIVL